MEDYEITHKDYLRVLKRRPDDTVILIKVLYKGKKKWFDYKKADNINFSQVLKAIIIFKHNNPIFVRTLDDEYAMQQVNMKKKKNNGKFYKKYKK